MKHRIKVARHNPTSDKAPFKMLKTITIEQLAQIKGAAYLTKAMMSRHDSVGFLLETHDKKELWCDMNVETFLDMAKQIERFYTNNKTGGLNGTSKTSVENN